MTQKDNYKNTDRQLRKTKAYYEGACPECHGKGKLVNLGWFDLLTCQDCKNAWSPHNTGLDDYSLQAQYLWDENYKIIKEYSFVQPYLPPESWEEKYKKKFCEIKHEVRGLKRDLVELVRVVFGMKKNPIK